MVHCFDVRDLARREYLGSWALKREVLSSFPLPTLGSEHSRDGMAIIPDRAVVSFVLGVRPGANLGPTGDDVDRWRYSHIEDCGIKKQLAGRAKLPIPVLTDYGRSPAGFNRRDENIWPSKIGYAILDPLVDLRCRGRETCSRPSLSVCSCYQFLRLTARRFHNALHLNVDHHLNYGRHSQEKGSNGNYLVVPPSPSPANPCPPTARERSTRAGPFWVAIPRLCLGWA
jgi:hypothetical protein